MNGTINIVPGAVGDEVQKLSQLIETFQELSDTYMKTNQKLDTWNSPNKVALEKRIEDSRPAFNEAVEVISSYRDVAGKSVALVNEAERQIREKLMIN